MRPSGSLNSGQAKASGRPWTKRGSLTHHPPRTSRPLESCGTALNGTLRAVRRLRGGGRRATASRGTDRPDPLGSDLQRPFPFVEHGRSRSCRATAAVDSKDDPPARRRQVVCPRGRSRLVGFVGRNACAMKTLRVQVRGTTDHRAVGCVIVSPSRERQKGQARCLGERASPQTRLAPLSIGIRVDFMAHARWRGNPDCSPPEDPHGR